MSTFKTLICLVSKHFEHDFENALPGATFGGAQRRDYAFSAAPKGGVMLSNYFENRPLLKETFYNICHSIFSKLQQIQISKEAGFEERRKLPGNGYTWTQGEAPVDGSGTQQRAGASGA